MEVNAIVPGGVPPNLGMVRTLLTVDEARGLQSMLKDRIEPGLSDAQMDEVEQRFGFEFAADHRVFLTAGLPVGHNWPDWRSGTDEALRRQLDWPVEGLLFDVEHNHLWLKQWGQRPADLAVALTEARGHLLKVQKLVPIAGHRYLPSIRGSWGMPVLSVYQSDIIVYGSDLCVYFHNEFGSKPKIFGPSSPVPFWNRFI